MWQSKNHHKHISHTFQWIEIQPKCYKEEFIIGMLLSWFLKPYVMIEVVWELETLLFDIEIIVGRVSFELWRALRQAYTKLYIFLLSLPNRILQLISLAGYKVVPTRSGVCNYRVKIPLRVENNTVRSGATTCVDLEAWQDWELVPWAWGGEIETLEVVVLMRVRTFWGKDVSYLRWGWSFWYLGYRLSWSPELYNS